jgi:Cd2+/Zn2+-exporting ATPase
MQKYSLHNLDCANCAAKIEKAVKNTHGVNFASVDFATTTLYLDAVDFSAVEHAVRRVEPEIVIFSEEEETTFEETFNVRKKLTPILISTLLFFTGLIFYEEFQTTSTSVGMWLILGAAYLLSGWDVLAGAVRNVSRGQVFDEQFLMSVATIGAIFIGELPEAVGVMLFYKIGEFAQEISVSRSRRSIKALLEVRPDYANLIVEEETRRVAPEDVAIGDLLLIRPGEKIPLDGEVVKGKSQVDTSPLTGESRPKNIQVGDIAYGGMINKTGLITLKVIRRFGESSISQIMDLVENAVSRKSVTENFITKFARVYSPIVIVIATLVAIVPPLLTGAPFVEWLYRALVVLVISCPCALVISIPLGYFGGVGGASRRGILVKGSHFLDVLASVRTVVFDKTGTLTQGVFNVSQVIPRNGFEDTDILHYAVKAESGSDHPIAVSIREAFGKTVDLTVDTYNEITGQGVISVVGGQEVLAGSDELLHRTAVEHDTALCDVDGTAVHVAVDGAYAGCLVISDELKPDAEEAIEALRALNMDQILMLTGDSETTAQKVATKLKLDDFQSGLLPEEKLDMVESFISTHSQDGKLAYVGDGINDAPALARADVGIAMGALGSQAAIETADVVIMTDSPIKIAEAISHGKRTRAIVWQNIIMALVIKIGFIALGIAGVANMWMAVIGDMGVAILAVLNAMRAMQIPKGE